MLIRILTNSILSVGDWVIKSDIKPALSSSSPFMSVWEDHTLDPSVAIELVPHLLSKKIEINNKTQFDVTNYSITSNVATLTLANTTDEIEFVDSLYEMLLYRSYSYTTGSSTTLPADYTDFAMTITLETAIGPITAGTYQLTNINPGSRTINFAYTNANTSDSVTSTVECYPHRVAGSSNAFWRKVHDTALMTPGQNPSGILRRDETQRITGVVSFKAGGVTGQSGAFTNTANGGASYDNNASSSARADFDSGNSTSEGGHRAGQRTQPRNTIVPIYIYAGRVINP